MSGKTVEPVAFWESNPITDTWKAGIEFRGIITENEAKHLAELILDFFLRNLQSSNQTAKVDE